MMEYKKNRSYFWGIILLLSLFASTHTLKAQDFMPNNPISVIDFEAPSINTLPQFPEQNILGVKEGWSPNSTVALLCAIIPGGGQLYNRKYWKIPLVLAATTACLYAVTWNARLYNEYHTAYVDFMNPNPLEKDSWKGFVPIGADPKKYLGDANIRNRLQKGTALYRRNRDLSIIVFAGVYLLSIVDAYVDAELFNFHVSPNISLNVSPALLPNSLTNRSISTGILCSLKF